MRAEQFARSYGFARFESSYASLISAPDIDLVYNALPVDSHASWSIEALKSGKHVLCEKPFAMNAHEAADVLRASQHSGRRVIEALHYRYHPGFELLLDWVGSVAPIRQIHARFHLPISDRDGEEIRHLPQKGGGSFMDLGCYPLSWMLALLDGEPESITATAELTHRGIDESLSTTLQFGDVMASLSASMAPSVPVEASFEVIGRTGRIVYFNPVAPHLHSRLCLETEHQRRTARPSRITSYTYQLSAVLKALDDGVPLPTEGVPILRQQRTLDAIYEAAGLRHLRYGAG